jgi:hypothetical protein
MPGPSCDCVCKALIHTLPPAMPETAVSAVALVVILAVVGALDALLYRVLR